MKIEIINKRRLELSAVMEEYDGYPMPEGQCLIESESCQNEKEFYEKRKRIHLDGVFINFFQKSSAHKQELRIKSDSSYIQMHFELSGGAAHYQSHDKRFAVTTTQGEFSMFYLPELNGSLIDPPCFDATSLEIEVSQKWIQEHLKFGTSTALDFVQDMECSRPTLLGGKNHRISPFIHHIIDDIYHCPYADNIKKLYMEGKLLELLALQLHQTGAIETQKRRLVLSKQDIEHLYFLKEKITADLSKDYTIDELSCMAFMNRTKMQAGFKELFGCTIHEFIVESRMMKAYRLMTEEYSSDWNIARIARHVGYQYYNHFSIAFKKRFGVSPSSFLKK